MSQKITAKIRMGYAVGHVLNDLCNAVWLSHTLLFFEYIVRFDSHVSGYLMLLGQLIDAVCTPGIGYISDTYKLIFFSRFGKRKSWYCLGTFITVVSLPLLYSECPGCSTANMFFQFFYYCLIIILFQMGWAAVATVHLALVTELTYSAKERTLLLALRNIFTTFSNLTVHIVTLVVLRVGSQMSNEGLFSKNDIWKFQSVVIAVMISGCITSLIFSLTVPEALIIQHYSSFTAEKKRIVDVLSQWELYRTGLFYMCTRVYCSIMQSMLPLYIHDSLHINVTNVALVPLTLYTASFFASLMTGPLNERFGKKITFSFGAILAAVASGWILFHSDNDQFKHVQIYFVGILYGSANSVMLVTALVATTDLVGFDTENSAFVYGIMTFLDKSSCGILICLIQVFKPEGYGKYYEYALSLSCGISAFIAAVIVISFPMEVYSVNVPDQKPKRGYE
ncbi:major facilitator superfamily domain-containing protein 12-like [Cimex lectularius]|uniref:Major facilitator superfamily domain-containing protein 12-like n=1 Tax=Cimex lectularius TaxID=79782 RepID=A0A8I6RDF6_CIMLE|nr:major facilitator superfamily domain-containing protein 12-like [Cimex lectularius]